ncbi:hypothetical protein W656_02599 [Staphylococcus aureus VET0435R]|nr:hypothetical protein W656_02599 [Staphylococcus aureus VET0435R]
MNDKINHLIKITGWFGTEPLKWELNKNTIL